MPRLSTATRLPTSGGGDGAREAGRGGGSGAAGGGAATSPPPVGNRGERGGGLTLQAARVTRREPGAARGSASGLLREVLGASLQAGHDGVHLVPCRLDLRRNSPLDPVAELGLALLHLAPGGREAHVLGAEPPALRLHLRLRRLELPQRPLGPRQVLGELSLLRTAAAARILDDRRRQTEPAGDLEREAASRHPVREPVGGRVRLRIESETGTGDAVRRRRVRLQQVVVRRRRHERAAAAKALDDGGAQRSTLRRVGSRPDLIQQNERRQRQSLLHLDDVGDVARERGQAVRDGLVVADVGEHRLEDAQPRAGARRDVEPGLGHQDQQSRGLQGHGLAAGVGTRYDEGPGRGGDLDVDRHRAIDSRFLRRAIYVLAGPGPDRGNEQRVPSGRQLDAGVGCERRFDAVDEAREARASLDDVELGSGGHGAAQIEAALAQSVRQAQQDAPDLVGLVLLEGDDVVVDLDRAQRLEKETGPAPELPCTMPGIEPRCSERTRSTKRPSRSVTTCSCR